MVIIIINYHKAKAVNDKDGNVDCYKDCFVKHFHDRTRLMKYSPREKERHHFQKLGRNTCNVIYNMTLCT